jgi:hypothetical protein
MFGLFDESIPVMKKHSYIGFAIVTFLNILFIGANTLPYFFIALEGDTSFSSILI